MIDFSYTDVTLRIILMVSKKRSEKNSSNHMLKRLVIYELLLTFVFRDEVFSLVITYSPLSESKKTVPSFLERIV